MENILKISLAVLMILCLIDMPYGYYQFVRFIGLIVFGILAFNEYQKDHYFMMCFYGASAILINPIFKITLGRTLWNILDIFWAIILLGSIFVFKKIQDHKSPK